MKNGILPAILAILLVGCQDSADSARIAELQAKVEEQQKTIEWLKKISIEANFKLFMADRTEVELDPAAKGFASIDTDIGQFYVRIRSIEPYLDGQKVTLAIGNPLSIAVANMKLKVNWGPRASSDDGEKKNAASPASAPARRDLEVSEPGTFAPAVWTPVTFVLPSTKAEQLGGIRVKLEFDTIHLR